MVSKHKFQLQNGVGKEIPDQLDTKNLQSFDILSFQISENILIENSMRVIYISLKHNK